MIRPCKGCFNEAEAVWPRKCSQIWPKKFSTPIASMRPRPFGLGNATIVIISQTRDNIASMRPRPFGLGNAPKEWLDSYREAKLQ